MYSSRFTRFTATLVLAAVLLAACAESPTPSAPSLAATRASASLSAGVLLPRAVVVFSDTAGVPALGLTLIRSLGGRITSSFDDIGVVFVDGLSVAALGQLAASNLVAGVSFDRLVNWIPNVRAAGVVDAGSTIGVKGDPWNARYYADGTMWGMRVIMADSAWRAGMLGTPSTKVAILDTGIDYDNRELKGLVDLSLSRSFSSLVAEAAGTVVDVPVEPQQPGDQPYMDNHFHGTHVASTVAANAISVAGVTQYTRLIAVKVLNFQGSGTFESVASGIRYAAGDADADVINMSLGAEIDATLEGADALFEMMRRTIKWAEKQGTIVISAAGNSGLDLDAGTVVATPCEQSTLCVSATGPTQQQNFDQPAVYTNYGITAVDVAAPGGNADEGYVNQDLIIGACSRRTTEPGLAPCRASTEGVTYFYAYAAGTSMATPHTSGVAALVKSLNPTLSVSGLRARILSSADDIGDPGRDVYSNRGRINAWGAVGSH